MYRPVLVTPPAITPVSLTEAKRQVRSDTADDDALLTAYIAAAVSHLDGWTGILGRCLVAQTWRQDFDAFCRHLYLPLFPVISIASIKYDDIDAIEQTVSPDQYALRNDDLGCYVQFVSGYSFPSLAMECPALRIEYVAGYANTGTDPNVVSTVPDALKHSILMRVAHWYENREAVAGIADMRVVPMACDALEAAFRRVRF